MKKTITAILAGIATIALAICLAACSKSFEGTYKFYSMSVDAGGITVNYEVGKEYMGVSISEDAYVLEVKKDNTWTMSVNMMGEQQTVEGTWEEKDGKYYLTAKDTDESIEVTVDGKKITFEQDGAKFVLKK